MMDERWVGKTEARLDRHDNDLNGLRAGISDVRRDIHAFRDADVKKHDELHASIIGLQLTLRADLALHAAEQARALQDHMHDERAATKAQWETIDQIRRWWWMAIGVLGFVTIVTPILLRVWIRPG